MNSKVLQASIQTLAQKLKELLKNYEEQQGVIKQLQEENKKLRQTADSSGVPLANFSNGLENGTIMSDKEQKRVLGSSIDSYIRDIDKIVAYLEQSR